MNKVLTFESLVCRAIRMRAVLEFEYDGLHRIVQPYCHGETHRGQETLRAVQIAGESRSGAIGYGKLWTVAKIGQPHVTGQTFVPDDPDYRPDDTALAHIHCRIEK